jgi:L-alanine-DL-glutamate epimerase-like enolase superfamily enzyme
MVLLRIRTEDGATGLGEGVPMSLRGGDSLAAVVRQLEDWCERAAGGESTFAGMSAPARIAAETAVADARARSRQVPLHTLLDAGSMRRAIECNATLTAGSPAQVLAQAERWASDGFTVFKLKLGVGDDVAQVRAVRDGLGDGVRIRIDVNGSWPENEAAARLAALEPFGIELAEQPVTGLAAMAGLRTSSDIPLVADESVTDAHEAAEAARLSACDAVTVKLSKTGTLDASLGGYLPTYLSSALDGPVGIAAAAHAALTLPHGRPWSEVAHGLATGRLFESSIASRESSLDGPRISPPPGPGLGVAIDEAALNRHRL